MDIDITQGIIITANELSHDSGKKYSLEDIKLFYADVKKLIDELQNYICEREI